MLVASHPDLLRFVSNHYVQFDFLLLLKVIKNVNVSRENVYQVSPPLPCMWLMTFHSYAVSMKCAYFCRAKNVLLFYSLCLQTTSPFCDLAGIHNEQVMHKCLEFNVISSPKAIKYSAFSNNWIFQVYKTRVQKRQWQWN